MDGGWIVSQFSIHMNKGFSITFANQVRVSVQFGPGNYCENHDDRAWDGKRGASCLNAEVAIINDATGEWLTKEMVPDAGDDVLPRIDSTELLALLNKAAAWSPNK